MDYFWPIRNEAGEVIGTRPCTDDEVRQIDPNAAALKELGDAVNQLILDALMGL